LAKRKGLEGWVPQNYLQEEIPAPKPAPAAPPPAPALRPAPQTAGRVSPATVTKPNANKPAFTPNGPTAARPVANGRLSCPSQLLNIGGVIGAPAPPKSSTATGRKVPPPAPSTRPSGSRATAGKPPPPPAPPAARQATGRPQANLAANLADMVTSFEYLHLTR
jgi:hypothetical protein